MINSIFVQVLSVLEPQVWASVLEEEKLPYIWYEPCVVERYLQEYVEVDGEESEEFDLEANLLSSVTHAFYRERPGRVRNIEDRVALMEENIKEMYSVMAVQLGFSIEKLPTALGDYVKAINRDAILYGVRVSDAAIRVDLFIILQYRITLVYMQATDMLFYTLAVYGDNKKQDWNKVYEAVKSVCEEFPEFAIGESVVKPYMMRLSFKPFLLQKMNLLQAAVFQEKMLLSCYRI